MTVQEIIIKCDELKPNSYDDTIKRDWLSDCDARIYENVMKNREYAPSFNQYEDTNEELLADENYSMMYVFYLFAQMDLMDGEIARYNNDSAMFNQMYQEFANWYNRNHMHNGHQFVNF